MLAFKCPGFDRGPAKKTSNTKNARTALHGRHGNPHTPQRFMCQNFLASPKNGVLWTPII